MIAASTRTNIVRSLPLTSTLSQAPVPVGLDRFENGAHRPIFEEGGIVGPHGSPAHAPVTARSPFMNNKVFASFGDFSKTVVENGGTLLLHPGMSFKLFVPAGTVPAGLDEHSPFDVTLLDKWPAPTHGPSGQWYEFKAKSDAKAYDSDELSFESACFPTEPELPFKLEVAPFLR